MGQFEDRILTMASALLFRLILSVVVMTSAVWMQTAPPGFLKTECRDSEFWVGLNKHFLAGKFWQISVVDPAGNIYLVTPDFASQCGYTIAVDPWDNIEFRASILSCCVHNVADEQFNLTVQIQVGSSRVVSSTYIQMLSCMYSPWAAREIFCEENYMQVSVPRNIPPIEQDYAQDAQDWSLVLPEATSAESKVWQVVFHVPGGRKRMSVKEAQKMNYQINTTVSRILFRAPYHNDEAQIVLVQGVPLSVIRSSTFYKQYWMIFVVDTAMACPLDGILFTDDIIMWILPRVFTPIVTSAVHQDNTSMGVNGIKLDPIKMAEQNYTLHKNDTTLAIRVPIGAPDGHYKSHVVDGQYGIMYSINLFLEHLWEDETWGLNKINVIRPVTTPFIPQPLVFIDDTIPEQWLFNVTLGNFLPDVELKKLTLGTQSFPVDEESQMFNVYNGTNNETVLNKIFLLEVPMESPVVHRKYIGNGIEQYTLDVIYTLTVVPENLTFVYIAHLIHQHKIALPVANGFCDEENITLVVMHETSDYYWIPFVGNVQLTPHYAERHGYTLSENNTHSVITIPRDAAPVVHEALNNQGLRNRFDFKLRDKKTLDVLVNFSVSCSFSIDNLLTCFPDGRIVITAVKLEALLGIDGKMMLKDKACKPKESTEFQATFEFTAASCGTSRRFEQDYMIYENEVAYFKKSAPSDPIYRLAISCHYHVNDTLHHQFEYQVNPQPVVSPGYGPLVLAMQLAKEVSYTNLYEDSDYPVVKYLADSLYFEVQLLHNEDPQIELFLQDCWATASQDQHGIPQWPIVVNSCENKADMHVTIFHPVSRSERVRYPTHFKRFEVKMFAFTLGNADILEQVYFHCSVVLCRTEPVNELLCPGLCVPGKQRMGRSADAEHHLRGYVSSGPVYLQVFPVENKIERDNNYMKSYSWILIGCSAIIIALIMFGIVGHKWQMNLCTLNINKC